jgi:hypothetical protein
MTSTSVPIRADALPMLIPSRELRDAPAAGVAAGAGNDHIRLATLCSDERLDGLVREVQRFALEVGATIDRECIPAHLARGGTIGRIGVPHDAISLMLRQQVVVGSSIGADPLAPVSRLWRGLQRRADVLVDLRQCTTLPGSAASVAGVERDVLLVSQRLVERATSRRPAPDANDTADQWTRARESADIVYRTAVAEQRSVLLVLPVGRATGMQQFFSDALARQARLHRLTPPRTVKAGLLSALLTGETGRERWLVASVIPIDDLAATAAEAVGDTGPWPVFSLGHGALFCGMPQQLAANLDPVPLLLVLEYLLRRAGKFETARLLMQSLRTTVAALHRTREEFGAPFEIPVRDFLRGVLSNWGRAPSAGGVRERRTTQRGGPVVSGLRLRIESTLSASDMRTAVSASLMPAGLEVASVRSMDAPTGAAYGVFDVRVRSRLGEPPLSDEAATALVRALGAAVRCAAIEPWIPGGASSRSPWRDESLPTVR